MSRNGSGSYSVPNTFVAGQTITAASHNQNWTDMASEMTNSVAADGQTSMTGPLKATTGSVGAPSITFASDTDTGRYRKSANTMADVVGGAEVVEISSSGVSVTGAVSASGAINASSIKQAGFVLLPVGLILPYAGFAEPSGYLFCYGQAVSRTTYAALFAIIGETYGAGDGSTTFNVPDIRGRVIAGRDDMGGSAASRLTATYFGGVATIRGAVGGSESHTLTTPQIPSHSHTATDSGHSHSFTAVQQSGSGLVSGGTGSPINPTVSTTGSGTANITVGNTGGGGAHNNVQPTIITNYIIFAGV